MDESTLKIVFLTCYCPNGSKPSTNTPKTQKMKQQALQQTSISLKSSKKNGQTPP
jgi:hypothetical protein